MLEGDPNRLGKVLITGGTGFIGRHLTGRLVAAGIHPVVTYRSDTALRRLGALQEHLTGLPADLLAPTEAARLAQEVRPDTWFHLAGVRSQDAALCEEVNLDITTQVLRAAVEGSVSRVVLLGTAEEYGPHSGPLHEELPLRPETPYGITKAAATRLAQSMARDQGCPVVILRPFTVYGEEQPESMFVAEAVRCAVERRPFKMSAGLQRRDLINVLDVVHALCAAAMREAVHGEVINVGSGQAQRLRDVAELIWRLSGTDAQLEIGARGAGAAELRDTWADIDKARRVLGWEPQIDLEAGLRWTIQSALSKNAVGKVVE